MMQPSKFTRAARLAALGGIALFSLGATGNWNATINETATGHVLGNPDAPLKLVAWESYTCPHCQAFEKESDGELRLGYIRSGKVSFEVRHLIRDPVDLTAAMLADCGPPEKFFDNHRAFFWTQDKWAPLLVRATQAQRDRWVQADGAAARRAIAADFGFYDLMANRGYDRAELDTCLNDNARAKKLLDDTDADDRDLGVNSTPSFALNGTVLIATHVWSLVKFQLDARLSPPDKH